MLSLRKRDDAGNPFAAPMVFSHARSDVSRRGAGEMLLAKLVQASDLPLIFQHAGDNPVRYVANMT